MALLVGLSVGAESFDYNSTMTGFLLVLGVVFPRQGISADLCLKISLSTSCCQFKNLRLHGFNFDSGDLNTVHNISDVPLFSASGPSTGAMLPVSPHGSNVQRRTCFDSHFERQFLTSTHEKLIPW